VSKPVSHLGTDWQDQWARVQRWHDRLSRFRIDLPDDMLFETKAIALDDVFAFYMNCWHLRDWLKNSKAKTKKELDKFFDDNPAMQLCRDVATGLKHYRLDVSGKYGSVPVHQNWMTTADPMTLLPPEPTRWYFVSDIGRYDMFSTADECVAAWRKFLNGAG
jgi:hypothetical protein